MNDDTHAPRPLNLDAAAVWPLDTVRDCFALLVAGPAPLAVDGCAFPGLPDRPVPLDELRDRLLAARCPQALRDAAWAEVVRRSRAHGGAWTVGCAGMALPALAAVAGRLSAHAPGDPADIHAEVVAGFVAALATVRLDLPRIMVRLRWAAYRAGLAAVSQTLAAPHPDPDLFDSRGGAHRSTTGHPDLVLVGAVARGVLTPTEADLIAATRLDSTPVSAWAAGHGMPPRAASRLRAHAERRLAADLTDPATPTDPDDPVPARPVTTATTPTGQSQPVTDRGVRQSAPNAAARRRVGVPACV
ncbi:MULTISPECIES: hypothetical protein [Protofrankia]|uniref:hypothetical protein n=1 Tax=Protofrankia TaxID=2994361 RepID=UPI0006408E35|nr:MULTISPECIES: hypothetical protein [Protofrankia]